MTGACPRCRAPIAGPICGACGLQLQAAPSPYAPPGYVPPGYAQQAPQQAPTMPQYGYPPPPQQYGYAQPQMQPGMQYIGPGGMPYVMMQVPSNLPSKKWAVVGGIMNIVASSIYLLFGLLVLLVLSEAHRSDKGSGMMLVFVFCCLCVAGIVFGAYSIRGRWGGALGGGILHTVLALMCFVGIGMVEEYKKRHDYAYSYYESSRDEGAEAIAGFLVLFALFSIITAIFCYIGIGGAKNRTRYEAHMRATEHF